MRRMHIGLQVDNLDESIVFYTRLFGTDPTLRRSDYAKWMLDEGYGTAEMPDPS
ncbi:VOC family protein [Candidatus Poriferisodalis sp.]|uniref:VOC family protein n=1 Tax=Candidatus Poriferisodalis sp. TaxID=3101277 RepID=UPI003D0E5BFC